jgi:hypothetical protein
VPVAGRYRFRVRSARHADDGRVTITYRAPKHVLENRFPRR